VKTLAPVWGLRGVRTAELETQYASPVRGGATIVALRQRVDGVEVYHGGLRVMVNADRSLHAVSGTRARADRGPRRDAWKLDGRAALAAALADRWGASVPVATIASARAHGDWQSFTVPARADVFVGPAVAKKVLVPDGDRLAAAWMVEVYGARTKTASTHLWRLVVDAGTGAIRERIDLVASDSFNYRVFAAGADKRPLDGPQTDFSPHPTGVPDGSQPAFVAPTLVTMEAFNGPVDPWLADGVTESNGNNVDAYVDLDDSADGFTAGDFRASTTAPGAFNRVYNTNQDPMVSQAQQMAAITQLFYINNWLHDWWYDSGFTEATGNAQADNFGRGGVDGDVMLSEAQDNALGGSRNNANMSTPSDGLSPRMQMFLWTGASTESITVNGSIDYDTNTASFGPQDFDVTRQVVSGVDGGGASTADGCEAFTNTLTNRIVLVDRGNCNFIVKAENAEAAGAAGLIIGNVSTSNNPTQAPGMSGTGAAPPTLSLNVDDNDALKALIAAGTTNARLFRESGVERDGDLDGTVVAHEWGHYLHHRLTDCSSTQQCGAMSEGWGDFLGLHLALRDGEDAHGVFPLAVYDTATLGDAYFGIRRVPYSVDRDVNGLTFKDIQTSQPTPTGFPFQDFGDNAEVHNAGEIWATMLWEAYVGLIDEHGYTIAHRRIGDYLAAGMQLSPPEHTILEMRDSILVAAAAVEPGDAVIIATAFASRGAGSCAVGPAASSFDLNGVVEDMGLHGALRLGGVSVDDDGTSCDDDHVLDPGEVGTLRVELANSGAADLTATTVTVSTTTPGVTVLDATQTLAPIAAFTGTVVSFTVQLDASMPSMTPASFSIQVEDTTACEPSVATSFETLTGYDDIAAQSATDSVESSHTPWTPTGLTSADVWSRRVIPSLTTAWVGRDSGGVSDTRLVSPVLDVATSGSFVVQFSHRHSFELSGGTAWDGGVIELSTDDGATWDDAATFGVTPGYSGVLTDESANPLGNRNAYAGQNPAYPARDSVTLDFGTQFSGTSVRIRFRIGTDQSVGDEGWELDDLAFGGITNTPFGIIVDQAPTCQLPPIANAGLDQEVTAGASVTLDGSGTTDPNGDPFTYAWEQVGGDPVTLAGEDTAQPTFTAGSGAVTFRLTASDAFGSSTDEVTVTAAADVPDADVPGDDVPGDDVPGDDTGGGDGGCCQTGKTPIGGRLLPVAFAALFLVRRRRRRT
jgi:hypothetical protein